MLDPFHHKNKEPMSFRWGVSRSGARRCFWWVAKESCNRGRGGVFRAAKVVHNSKGVESRATTHQSIPLSSGGYPNIPQRSITYDNIP